MNKHKTKLWPYKPGFSILWSLILMVVLITAFILLGKKLNWPSKDSEVTVLLGALLFSILPVILVLIDAIMERGGSFEFQGVKVTLPETSNAGMHGFTVPDNIGASGQPITDSSTTQILETLRQASTCDIVIIDVKDGQAWLETRLLVLLSGAVRLGKPAKLVFVGKKGNQDYCFLGWGHPDELLPHLLKSNPQYAQSYHAALSAGRQWELVEPSENKVPPMTPSWMTPGALSTRHPWMAFDPTSGLPNPFLTEQLLASDLGEKVENAPQSIWISSSKVWGHFGPALHVQIIDETWGEAQQLDALLSIGDDYIAITNNGKYEAIVSRLALFSELVKTMVKPANHNSKAA